MSGTKLPRGAAGLLQPALRLALTTAIVLAAALSAQAAPSDIPYGGFVFGQRELSNEPFFQNPNNGGQPWTMVHHNNANINNNTTNLRYNAARGWGFVEINPGNTDRGGWGVLGPFDDSPNDRNQFPSTTTTDRIFDSFIGWKDRNNAPAGPGGKFRIDVPNGEYRFVAAVGDSDFPHTSGLLVEDGGTTSAVDVGAPTNNFVTLIGMHDQGRYAALSPVDTDGSGVFGLVGYRDLGTLYAPPGAAGSPGPVFINYDASGNPLIDGANNPTGADPDSPTLLVTQGYITLHMLMFDSQFGGQNNGGDMIVFEAHQQQIIPEPTGIALALLGLAGAGLFAWRRRRRPRCLHRPA